VTSGEPPALLREAITFRWDLDKTYLRTEFESLRRMVRIPFEAAADKVHLPGVPQMIQALRRCAASRGERPFVFFLSASPPQIGAAIREKLRLDGIEYEGITFKDQLRNLIRGKWRTLREQIGYKLGELLEARLRGPAARREVLFGDDWESDPLIYSLYADVLAGTVSADLLQELLQVLDVERSALKRVVRAAEGLAPAPVDAVERIYINLERRTPPQRFRVFGPRLVPAFNYFQTAASLFEVGLIDAAALPGIASAVSEIGGSAGDHLRNSLDDLLRRGHLRPSTRVRILADLARAGLLTRGKRDRLWRARWIELIERWRSRVGRKRRTTPKVEIDYRALVLARSGRR
jgi:hypothetical protein